jgi:Reverse transcriptase (RNA-dependent DNA polymerase)
MNVMRAYGIDILCSTATPRFRIGTFGHVFSLMNKPDLSPRLQASDPASPASMEGKSTPEPAEFAPPVENCAINPDLTSDQRDLLHAISSFPIAFALGSHQLGSCPEDEMEVDVPTPMPPVLRKAAYRRSPRSRAVPDVALDDLISCGIIRPSRSRFPSPAISMCVDYRALNTFTVPISYPMPRVAESLSLLHGAKYISCLDANKGFHQVRLAPSSQPMTAFSTHRGLFEYHRMPFALKNAPAIFQSIMDRILHSELREGWARVYIDDIIVFSPTFELHVGHLRRIFIDWKRLDSPFP